MYINIQQKAAGETLTAFHSFIHYNIMLKKRAQDNIILYNIYLIFVC